MSLDRQASRAMNQLKRDVSSGGKEEGTSIDGYDLHLTDNSRNRNEAATARYLPLGNEFGISLNFTYFDEQYYLLPMYRSFDSNVDNFPDER
ncbi:hypothetical protein J6590_003141 [Homalodisca vitripennis]|nr:hypothetical protein J6590_003141 [Homalodisca vitripennis]